MYQNITPYAYAANQPTNAIDPTVGKEVAGSYRQVGPVMCTTGPVIPRPYVFFKPRRHPRLSLKINL